MKENIFNLFNSNFVIFSTLLSLFLPITFYKLNQKLHKYGDPPWKKQEKSEDSPVENTITYPENE